MNEKNKIKKEINKIFSFIIKIYKFNLIKNFENITYFIIFFTNKIWILFKFMNSKLYLTL